MKFKKILPYCKKHLNQLIFSFYLGTITNIFIYLLISNFILDGIIYKIALLGIILSIYILSFFISKFLLKQINKIKPPHGLSLKKNQRLKIFLYFFLTGFLISSIWFLAYKPGGFSPDSIHQYQQSISGEYTDWHPALHTLLFFTIPLSIFHNISAIVICQIILFSIVISYTALTIFEIAGKKWSIATFLLIVLNPWVMDELMFPWKDVAFGIIALLITTFCLKIYSSKGLWAQKTSRTIIFAIAICCVTIFRHNGILFTAPVIIFLFFLLQRKAWLKITIFSLISIFLIKVPLYSLLNVSNPSERTTETMGLPMTVLANVTKETPWVLNEGSSSLMYEIAHQEKYESIYKTGDFNSIKWSSDTSAIEKAGIANIIGYTFDVFQKSPKASSTALFELTRVVYAIDGPTLSHDIPNINPSAEEKGITYQGNTFLKSGVEVYRFIFNNSILKYLGFIGTTIIVMLAFILGKNSWEKGGWKKILLCTPILFYDFGTMLFLTGPEPRFFFVNFLVYPVIIILATTLKPKGK